MSAIPTEPFATPDAWRGETMQGRQDWCYKFTEGDIDDLRAGLKAARRTGQPFRAWSRDDFPLPFLAPKIENWMTVFNVGRGFILLRGFPVIDFDQRDREEIFWGLGLHMGTAVSQNANGDVLGHVRDTGADPTEHGVRLYKTRAEQDFHTDGADIIGLFCLRGAKSGGISRIVSSVSIFNEILRRKPELAPTLFESFPFCAQEQEGPGQNPWFDVPLCGVSDDRLRTFFIGWYIRESQQHDRAPRLKGAQIECINLIEEIANDPAFYLDMNFEPGDMQFLKNASVLHKRTAFEDWDNPEKKRHLLRLWLIGREFVGVDQKARRGFAKNDLAKA
jgi:hypothetical protein